MRRLIGVIILALVAGCAADKPTDAVVQLYVFDCGRLLLDDVQAFGLRNEETDVRELSVPCYVVQHAAGRLLWDGGLPSSVARTPGWHRGGTFFSQRLDRTFADQLKAMGWGMGEFDFIAFSHMHWDHVGVANEIENATLLIQRSEHEAAFAERITVPGGFERALYAELAQAETILLEGEHDVFGDGRVRIITAPGHTPGHQVLFVALEEHGPVVLGGDLYHFRFNRENRRVPRFNFDVDETLKSMRKIEELVSETGAELWIEHELAWFERLRLAPEFYR